MFTPYNVCVKANSLKHYLKSQFYLLRQYWFEFFGFRKDLGSKIPNLTHIDRPVLCVDVEIKGPASGLVCYANIGSFSKSGGPESFLQREQPRNISPWVHLSLVDTVLPVVRPNSRHNFERVLYLENELMSTDNVRLPERAAVPAEYGIFALSYIELRFFAKTSDRIGRRGKFCGG